MVFTFFTMKVYRAFQLELQAKKVLDAMGADYREADPGGVTKRHLYFFRGMGGG